jgi:hypothetical protein
LFHFSPILKLLVGFYREAANAGHQRRARTAGSDKPCMRDMLDARPLHAFVRLPFVAHASAETTLQQTMRLLRSA